MMKSRWEKAEWSTNFNHERWLEMERWMGSKRQERKRRKVGVATGAPKKIVTRDIQGGSG